MTRSILAVAGVLLAAGTAQGALLASFENDPEGLTAVDGTGYTIAFSNTEGVTHGSYSAAIGIPTGYQNGNLRISVTPARYDLIKLADSVAIDVTYNGAIPGGSQLQIGWMLQGSYKLEGVDTFFNTGGNQSVTGITTPGTHTIVFPFENMIDLPDNSTLNWGEFRIFTNPAGGFGTPDTTYFDNFRTVEVPEPAAFGLLAAGGLLALRRRRG